MADELTELEKKATPAPWRIEAGNRGGDTQVWARDECLSDDTQYYPTTFSADDMAFIVALRNALPELRDETARMRREIRGLKEQLAELKTQLDAACEDREMWKKRALRRFRVKES